MPVFCVTSTYQGRIVVSPPLPKPDAAALAAVLAREAHTNIRLTAVGLKGTAAR